MTTRANIFEFVSTKQILAWSLCATLGLTSNTVFGQTLGQPFLPASAQTSTPITTTSTFLPSTHSHATSQQANASSSPIARRAPTYNPINFDSVSLLNHAVAPSYTPISPLGAKRQGDPSQGTISAGPHARVASPPQGISSATQGNVMVAQNSNLVVQLPEHIPVSCVTEAAQRYQVPEMALISIIRQESGGRHVIGNNNNGSRDYGPAQINDRTWGEYLQKNYNITLNDVLNNMCQAIMVQAYILRLAWNSCMARGNTDIWCGIANYHSPDPTHQKNYVTAVWKQHQYIVAQGRF